MNEVIQMNRYVDGRLFLDVRGKYVERQFFRRPRARPIFAISKSMTWPQLWERVQEELKRTGYGRNSIKLYRQVLRQLRDAGVSRPANATRSLVRSYIHRMAEDYPSWSWLATNISVLRTVFDKMAGCSVTVGLVTPKRPSRLPETLRQHQIMDILKSAETVRDQLILGLLYGCGLKVGELCALRWRDVDPEGQRLHVEFARGTLERYVALPPGLLPVLRRGVDECPVDDYIFQGRKSGTHLTTRAVGQVLKNACRRADISITTSCMVLRHSYAVHCLEMGMTIIELRNALGHKSVETTLVYEACVPKRDGNHPLTQVRRCYRQFMTPGALPKVSSLDGLRLPFHDERLTLGERAREFYCMLKVHLAGRFLARLTSTGPPG